MTFIVIPPIEVSITISFFPENELLLLELDKKGYEEIVFDNKIKQNSKFFETKFEKSIEITRLIPANEHHEKVKLFSISGFIPGKKQRVSIVSLSIDKEKKGNFKQYCGFQMKENEYVKNKFLSNESELCFNGEFYFMSQIKKELTTKTKGQ